MSKRNTYPVRSSIIALCAAGSALLVSGCEAQGPSVDTATAEEQLQLNQTAKNIAVLALEAYVKLAQSDACSTDTTSTPAIDCLVTPGSANGLVYTSQTFRPATAGSIDNSTEGIQFFVEKQSDGMTDVDLYINQSTTNQTASGESNNKRPGTFSDASMKFELPTKPGADTSTPAGIAALLVDESIKLRQVHTGMSGYGVGADYQTLSVISDSKVTTTFASFNQGIPPVDEWASYTVGHELPLVEQVIPRA